METMQLHRGRLIDHIQLVVKDIGASKRFYKALFEVLGIPLSGEADDHVWYDELFISQIGPHSDEFFTAYQSEVIPALREA